MSEDDEGVAVKWFELWREQCRAAEGIEERFGKQRAMDYIVGEKFVGHLRAADTYPELVAETPKFAAEIKAMYQTWEIDQYFQSVNSSRTVDKKTDDNYEFDEIDSEIMVAEAEQIVLMEKAKSLLLANRQ